MYATKLDRIALRAALPALALLVLVAACSKEATFSGKNADKLQPKVVVDQTFPAATIGSESLTTDPAYGTVTQTLSLVEKPPVVMTMKQVDRVKAVEAFSQGRTGDRPVETATISDAGKLDLLIVVDNSGSMSDKQAKLKDNLNSLITQLARVDWQIAVITTESSCIRKGVIKKNENSDPSNDERAKHFSDAIDAGDGGYGYERGIYYALKALDGKCENGHNPDNVKYGDDYSFIREDASFGLLILSDEESYCSGTYDPNNLDSGCKPGETTKDLIDKLKGLKSVAGRVGVYPITWDSDLCSSTSSESKGARYLKVAAEVNADGKSHMGSICAGKADFEENLKKISNDVKNTVKLEISLQFPPDAKSVSLKMIDKDDKAHPFTDFEIVGKKVILRNVQDDDRKVEISYSYNSLPKFDRFHLSVSPGLDSVEVFVNDQKSDPSKLSIDTQSNEIVFAEMPPDNAKIEVKFRSGELRKSFSTPWADMDGAPLSVTVDGQAAQPAFDATAKAIEFPEAPKDGAEVKVTYNTIGGTKTSYDAHLRADAPLRHELEAKDAQTGVDVPVTLVDSKLVFSQDDIYDGRLVAVTYDYGSHTDLLTQELTHEPMDGSVKVEAIGADGQSCVDRVDIVGKTVTFGCTSDTMGAVGVSYKYVVETYSRFDVQGVPDGDGIWQVYVDGAAVPFQRDGNTVMVSPELLTLESKVRVLITVMQ